MRFVYQYIHFKGQLQHPNIELGLNPNEFGIFASEPLDKS